MDTWFNASGGGGGQNITIDGSVLKDMKLTIKESWLNVGEIPVILNNYHVLNTKSKYYGKPVDLDGYLYGFLYVGSTGATKSLLVKFDEKGHEVVCNMPYNSASYNYFCKYKGSLYVIYKNNSSSPSIPTGEIWKFNPDTKSFTKVVTIQTATYDIYGAIEYVGDLHFFVRNYEEGTNKYRHYKFDGSSITLVTDNSPFVSVNILYGVREGYLYALNYPTNVQSVETRFFKRFNGTSWSDYSTDFLNKIPNYNESLQNIPFLIDDNHFMYPSYSSAQFVEVTSGNTYKNSIIAPYALCSGALLMFKGKLTLLSGYTETKYGGNGLFNNFFVREKILCLEG
jgi:hypothetical protein